LNNFIKKYVTERLIFDDKFRLGPVIYLFKIMHFEIFKWIHVW